MCTCQQKTQKTTERRESHDSKDETNPFPGIEGRVKNKGHEQQRDGYDHGEASVGTLLTLVFAGPVEVIAFVQVHLLPDILDCLAYRAPQVAPPHTIFD